MRAMLIAIGILALTAAAQAQDVVTTLTLTVEVAIPGGPTATRTETVTIAEDALTTDTAAIEAELEGAFDYIDTLPISTAAAQAHKDGMLALALARANQAAVLALRDYVVEQQEGNGMLIQMARRIEAILGRIVVSE